MGGLLDYFIFSRDVLVFCCGDLGWFLLGRCGKVVFWVFKCVGELR
jgi:hypothetical protein